MVKKIHLMPQINVLPSNCPDLLLVYLFIYFFISKNRYFIDEREVPKSTQGVDTKNHPSKKTRDKKNYLLPNQVKKSTTEFVLSSLNILAQAHKLVTKLALIF